MGGTGSPVLLSDAAATPQRLADELSALLGTESAAALLAQSQRILTLQSKSAQPSPPSPPPSPPADQEDAVTPFGASSPRAPGGALAGEELIRSQQEELQIVKATTMYRMVEDLDDGQGKLLLLSNSQADLISRSPVLLERMMHALGVPKPSLVINLMKSWGFRSSCAIRDTFRPRICRHPAIFS